MNLKNILAAMALTGAISASAAIPAGYYSSCEGRSGKALLQQLHKVMGYQNSEFNNVGYDGLWELYLSTDVYPNGKIWDMYSTKEWTPQKERCGSYKLVGDCYNREHSLPKSWFKEASPMKSDAFHVIPTDGKVNGQRSNHPYGECANGTRLASNGSVRALGKLGTCTFPGYTGTVFEPDDEYKGDMARAYFYMAACYNDKIGNWSSDMLDGTSFPVFTPWAVNLLMKWHRQDPVSQKELDRNEAVAAAQGNRNPFIDYPELAEYIWGDKASTPWDPNVEHEPVINRPAHGSTVAFGVCAVGIRSARTVVIKSSNLSQTVKVAVSGAGFSASTSSVQPSATNSASGTEITLYCQASVPGELSGTLTLTSGSAKSVVTLTAVAADGLPADVVEVSDTEFTARWVYVGDEYADGTYRLDVRDADSSLPGYPRGVAAKAGEFVVADLCPETAYTFTVASRSLTSAPVAVTTATAIPSVDILYDGDLYLTAEPGIPSEEAELFVDIDNIPGNVTLTVQPPFQLSTDHCNWSTSATLTAGEDRVYLRLLGDECGTYATSIVATAEGYYNDSAAVEGAISADATFTEDFEPAGQSTYTPFTYQGTAAKWEMNDAGFWAGDPVGEGRQSVRFGKKAYSSITMAEDRPNGVGTVQFIARSWASDGDATLSLDYSEDRGLSWTEAGTVTVSGTDYTTFTFVVNRRGEVRLRVSQHTGARLMLDLLTASDFRGSSAADDPEVHSWDAWSTPGQLHISTTVEQPVEVYSPDGTKWFGRTVQPGSVALNLPSGFYIVATEGFSRRVVVK